MKQIKTVEQIYKLAQKKKSVMIKCKNGRSLRQPAAFIINYNASYLVSIIRNQGVYEYTPKKSPTPKVQYWVFIAHQRIEKFYSFKKLSKFLRGFNPLRIEVQKKKDGLLYSGQIITYKNGNTGVKF